MVIRLVSLDCTIYLLGVGVFTIEVEDSRLIGTGIYVHYLRLGHNNGVYHQNDYPRVACHCWLECACIGTELSFVCMYRECFGACFGM